MKRSFYSLLLGLLVLIFLAGTWFGYQSEKMKKPALASEPAPAAGASAGEEAIVSSRVIFPGESLYEALTQMGVADALILEWRKLARPIYDIARVRPGQKITVSRDNAGEVKRFELGIGRAGESKLVITKAGNGYEAELVKQEPMPEKPEAKEANGAAGSRSYYQGAVDSSLYQAALDAEMDPELIMNLANIFSIQMDYSRMMRKSDRFEVLTQVFPAGDEKIIAAKIVVADKEYNAYYYESGRSRGYFDEQGRVWEGFQMIRPVRNCRITSTYSRRRYNPILGRYAPHLAVDYAAPVGTPVSSAAGGVVTYADWKGGYGNYLEIRHNSVYTTTYGHLQRFAWGIHKGSRVKQGQVIGYIGTTGLSTGPHLDYRIIKNGGSINPLRFRGVRVSRAANSAQFQQTRLAMEIEMEIFKQRIENPGQYSLLTASFIPLR